MKILIPAGVIILLLSFSGCYYDSKEFLYPQLNTTCDTTNITFSGSVKPILNNWCISCHSNAAAASSGGNIKLQDYADVYIQANNGKLLGSLMHSGGFSPMPKNSAMRTDCEIATIQKWINAGALNN